jgi:hypothetical protein
VLTESVATRFWTKVDKSGCWPLIRRCPGRCWEWTASRRADGYGQFRVGGRVGGRILRAHRVAYELLVGPIPADLVIDHVCRNRGCVNPQHLEPVTQQVNVLRGYSPAAAGARAAHCPKGHPYDEANTFRSRKGKRLCRACHRSWSSAGYYRRKNVA